MSCWVSIFLISCFTFSFKGQKGWIKAIHWKSKRRFVQNVTCLKNKKQNNNKQNRLKITWRVLLYEWKITSCGSNFCINFRNIFQVHSVLKHINYIMYNMDQRNINKYNLKIVCSTYSHFFRIQPYHIRDNCIGLLESMTNFLAGFVSNKKSYFLVIYFRTAILQQLQEWHDKGSIVRN